MQTRTRSTLTLCLGSSCFTRGNHELLPRIQALLARRGWEERVLLKGVRCEGQCLCGPNLRIEEDLHQGLDEGGVEALLAARLERGADGIPAAGLEQGAR